MTHQKRLSAPRHYPIDRKENSYITTIKGSRSKEEAVPVVVVLRDILEYAENKKEAKKIVRNGDMLRNGDRVRDVQEGVGLLDVVEFPDAEEQYRAIRSGDYLEFVPIEDGEKTVAKITGKRTDGEKLVYSLHNGENYSTKDEYDTGNSLLFGESVEEIELAEDSRVLVTDGSHSGKVGTLQKIDDNGSIKSAALIDTGDEAIETETENLVAIGETEVGDR